MTLDRYFCSRCGGKVQPRTIDNIIRQYCPVCQTIFYDNPLPVVSAVVVNEQREILLVLRDREPQAGRWCLPSGFVEIKESIEAACLRELAEEAGIRGSVIRLLDTVSHHDAQYGDLIWISFEVKWDEGSVTAGDDARDARFVPLTALPELAFEPNRLAVRRYLDQYRDLWRMQDSFRYLRGEQGLNSDLPSDALIKIISQDAHMITENWVAEVCSHPTTVHYTTLPREKIYRRAHTVIAQFGDWLRMPPNETNPIWEYYRGMGGERRSEGFRLAEVLSAVSLTRKHIFAHVLAQGGVWAKPLDMYIAMEFMTRVNLFFDKAVYYITRGYEKAGEKSE
ncbi:MAG: NUDIX hydrolase [Candidatus Neomarinimicrobiota bacterium]